MYYIIKRENDLNIITEGTQNSFQLNESTFDIVPSQKNSGLERISDFVVENNVVVKADPRTKSQFTESFESATGIQLQELLFS